jgi:4-amino-4-deoxy-L-arabinose transferase-like glycosyltransferase
MAQKQVPKGETHRWLAVTKVRDFACRATVIRHGPILLLLVFFGAVYAMTLNSNGMFMWDEAEYASLGRSLVRGEGFAISGKPNSLRPPVLPLAAAASMLLCRSSQDAVVKLPHLVFSLLALYIVYYCAMTAYDRTTGLVAATFLGVSPTFWTSTPLFLTEIPFMAFFTGAVMFFYFGLYRHQHYFSLSWLCWGSAFLTRYTALLFGPIVVLFLIPALCTRNQDVRRRIRSPSLFLSPFLGLAVVFPWMLRQQFTFGNALVGVQQSSTQLQVYMPDVSMPWDFYLAQLPEMLSPSLALLLLIGIGWTVWKRERCGLHCLVVCVGILLWFSFYRYKEVRLITSILPFMAVLAAVGLVKAFFPVPLSWRSVAVLALLLEGIFAVNFRATQPTFQYRTTLGYPSFLNAMQFLREHSSPDALVIGANYPQIHWYADRHALDLPHENRLKEILMSSEWVILTDFERGQKRYAHELVKKVSQADVQEGSVAVFRDSQFVTVLIRSSVLRDRL